VVISLRTSSWASVFKPTIAGHDDRTLRGHSAITELHTVSVTMVYGRDPLFRCDATVLLGAFCM